MAAAAVPRRARHRAGGARPAPARHAHTAPACRPTRRRPRSRPGPHCALAREPRPGDGLVVGLHDDVLEQLAEAGFDRPLVVRRRPRGSRRPSPAGRPRRPALRRGSGARRRRTPRAPRRAPRAISAEPDAGEVCSRVAQLAAPRRPGRRARPPARTRARPASSRSDVHAPRARARIDPRAAVALLFGAHPPRRAGRRLQPRAWRAARAIADFAAVACSIAWRSAVAALTAANTSLRAASTSPSRPSMWRWTSAYPISSAAQRLGGLVAPVPRARRGLAPRLELEPRRLAAALQRLHLCLDVGGRARRAGRSAAGRTRPAAAAGRSPARWRAPPRARQSSRRRPRSARGAAARASSRARPATRRRPFRAAAHPRAGRARLRSPRRAGGSAARTAPSPSAAALPAAACSGAPWLPAASARPAASRPRRRCRRRASGSAVRLRA